MTNKTLTTIILASSVFLMNSTRGYPKGGEGRNGGGFVESSFRATAKDEILPVLKKYRRPGIDPDLFEKKVQTAAIQVTSQPLTHPKKGTVDALNFPSENLIQLYKSAWESRFRAGADVRFMVLHEYLGLMGVEDSDFRVSSTIFPVNAFAPRFTSAALKCSATVTLIQNGNDNLPGKTSVDIFDTHIESMEAPWKTGFQVHPLPNVPYINPNLRAQAKRAELEMPVTVDYASSFKGEYRILVTAELTDSIPDRSIRPFLRVSTKLVFDEDGSPERVIATAEKIDDGNDRRELIMTNTQLDSLMLQKGLSPDPDYRDGFAYWVAIRKHVAESTDQARLNLKLAEFFKPMPLVFPVRAEVGCWPTGSAPKPL